MAAHHHFLYQVFVVYICLKAAVLLPLAWFTFLVRRSEKLANASNVAPSDPNPLGLIPANSDKADLPHAA